MDFSEYISVLCQTDGGFRGKSYWEKISSVVSHNGTSTDRPMKKSDFAEGDEVVIHFGGRDYKGMVKSSSERDITTRSQSPAHAQPLSPGGSGEPTENAREPVKIKNIPLSLPSKTTPKKRRPAAKKRG